VIIKAVLSRPLCLGLSSFTLAFGLIVLLGSVVKVPDYGTWTGIRPLETKLEQLEKFARGKEVDAVFLGSSIVDFGFSADLSSRLIRSNVKATNSIIGINGER